MLKSIQRVKKIQKSNMNLSFDWDTKEETRPCSREKHSTWDFTTEVHGGSFSFCFCHEMQCDMWENRLKMPFNNVHWISFSPGGLETHHKDTKKRDVSKYKNAQKGLFISCFCEHMKTWTCGAHKVFKNNKYSDLLKSGSKCVHKVSFFMWFSWRI